MAAPELALPEEVEEYYHPSKLKAGMAGAIAGMAAPFVAGPVTSAITAQIKGPLGDWVLSWEVPQKRLVRPYFKEIVDRHFGGLDETEPISSMDSWRRPKPATLEKLGLTYASSIGELKHEGLDRVVEHLEPMEGRTVRAISEKGVRRMKGAAQAGTWGFGLGTLIPGGLAGTMAGTAYGKRIGRRAERALHTTEAEEAKEAKEAEEAKEAKEAEEAKEGDRMKRRTIKKLIRYLERLLSDAT